MRVGRMCVVDPHIVRGEGGFRQFRHGRKQSVSAGSKCVGVSVRLLRLLAVLLLPSVVVVLACGSSRPALRTLCMY
jgi:hypothetical protein